MESWKDAAEALEPEADRVFVVTLTAERVGARNAMMDIGRESFHRFIPAMIVHVIVGLPDFHPQWNRKSSLFSVVKISLMWSRAAAQFHPQPVLCIARE